MKKTLTILALVALVFSITACKEKRCKCTTFRGNSTIPAYSLEPLGSHKKCSDLDKEWQASDSTGDIIKMSCVPEVN